MVYKTSSFINKMKKTNIKLPLHTSKLQQPQTTINRLHTLIHSTSLLAILYYRFTSLFHQPFFFPSLLISLSELLHSFLWILGQAFRWRPVSRSVYPERLPQDEHLPAIDVFICTADAKTEPTLGVMNTVISAMCLDYPPEKVFVYLSDDGGAPVTLFGMKEGYKFAKSWVPFCKKYGIKTIAPTAYFKELENHESQVSCDSEFIQTRNELKMMYEDYEERIERARDCDGALSSPQDRPPLVEVIREDDIDNAIKNQADLPFLVYVSREKRSSRPHNFKAGALNALLRVSGIISNSPYILFLDCDMYCNDPTSTRQAMCFHMDPNISSSLAFVQFPQKFHNVSNNDIYNDLLRSFFEIQLFGVDGLKGPLLSGTCLYMKREALFRSPKQEDVNLRTNTPDVGCSNLFIMSLLREKKLESLGNSENIVNKLLEEASLVASCTYEEHTQWGEQIGYMYGTVIEDYLTGLIMHCKGWTSVYHDPPRPAFLGSVTINLSDALVQTTRWSSGLLQIAFSKFCPLIYGTSRMSILQSMAYSSMAFMNLSAPPLLCYAILPQLCLIKGISVYPKVSTPWFAFFAIIYASWHFQHLYETLSSGGSLKLWWNHQRILLIKSVTAYFTACLDVVMKLAGIRKEINFVPTSKVVVDEQVKRYEMGIFDFQVATWFLIPLTMIVSLNASSFIIGLAKGNYEDMFGQIYLSLFIVVISYPILEGMIIRKDKGRVPTYVTIMSGVITVVILSYVLL